MESNARGLENSVLGFYFAFEPGTVFFKEGLHEKINTNLDTRAN
jgi:hypothetical protein